MRARAGRTVAVQVDAGPAPRPIGDWRVSGTRRTRRMRVRRGGDTGDVQHPERRHRRRHTCRRRYSDSRLWGLSRAQCERLWGKRDERWRVKENALFAPFPRELPVFRAMERVRLEHQNARWNAQRLDYRPSRGRRRPRSCAFARAAPRTRRDSTRERHIARVPGAPAGGFARQRGDRTDERVH